MGRRRAERIEAFVDHGAAAVLAAAVATALFLVHPGGLAQNARVALAAASGIAAYLLTVRSLRRVGVSSAGFVLRPFDLPDLNIEPLEELVLTDADRLKQTISQLADELVLTEADRVQPECGELLLTDAERLRPSADELVLDDILAELGPNSRVVRLFDPAAMPTPAQLNARIEQHLHGSSCPAAPADASHALYQALTELRRSLR